MSVYLGDALNFAVYAIASQPALYDNIRSEADALFDNGDPDGEGFTPSAIDVTHRFLMECLRMYPIVPMSIGNGGAKLVHGSGGIVSLRAEQNSAT